MILNHDATAVEMTDALTPPLFADSPALSSSREVAAMRAVLDVSKSVAASLDLDALLDCALDAIARLVPTSRASITLDVPGRDVLRVVKVHGTPEYVAEVTGAERPISGSITGRSYARREPYIVDDMLSPEWRRQMFLPKNDPNRHAEERSGLFMPLVADHCVGVVFLARRGMGQFTGEDSRILALFAPLVAIAVTNARRYAAAQEQARGLRALFAASERFATERVAADEPLVRFARVIAEEAGRIVSHDRTAVSRCHPDEATYRTLVYVRDGVPQEPKGSLPRGSGITGAAIERGEAALVNDSQNDPRSQYFYGEDRAAIREHLIVTPFIIAGEVTGALTVIRRDRAPFTEEEFSRLLIFARIAAASMERVEFLARLREQNAALIAAGKHKDAFFAHMNHELRTPLNAIIGFADLLANGVIVGDTNRREAYSDILTSGNHLLTVVNDVLDVARIESGQERVPCVPTPLAPVLAATERITAPLFAAKGQRFALHVPDPAPVVLADADRLRQVLLNLLANAQKFTPSGGAVSVSVSPIRDGCVYIAVADTGIGIAPEHQTLVFEAFRQVESDYVRTQSGTGLGLALTKRLVELMGGTITLESSPGAGSTFAVSLRAAV